MKYYAFQLERDSANSFLGMTVKAKTLRDAWEQTKELFNSIHTEDPLYDYVSPYYTTKTGTRHWTLWKKIRDKGILQEIQDFNNERQVFRKLQGE